MQADPKKKSNIRITVKKEMKLMYKYTNDILYIYTRLCNFYVFHYALQKHEIKIRLSVILRIFYSQKNKKSEAFMWNYEVSKNPRKQLTNKELQNK